MGAPMKDNEAYKGEWSVKRISNPAYKGFWEAKKIANPEFVDDDTLYSFKDFGFLGFDLWQVKGGTIFDNIILTDDVAEADAFAKKWLPKLQLAVCRDIRTPQCRLHCRTDGTCQSLH